MQSDEKKSFLEKLVEIPRNNFDLDTVDKLNRIRDNPLPIQNCLGVLAGHPNHQDYLPEALGNSELAELLCSVEDTRARTMLGQYAGHVMESASEEKTLEPLLALNKPLLQYSRQQIQDVSLRLDALSHMPEHSFSETSGYPDANAVYTALNLSGEPLQEYYGMLYDLQTLGYDKMDCVSVFKFLSSDNISHGDLQKYFSYTRELISDGKDLEIIEPLASALPTGKPERMDYVKTIIDKASEIYEPEDSSRMQTTMKDYSDFVSRFIRMENDNNVKELYNKTMSLLEQGGIEKNNIWDLSKNLENNLPLGGPYNREGENLSETELAYRTIEAMDELIR